MGTFLKKFSAFSYSQLKPETFSLKNSYHDFFIITTFDDKADKLKGFQ